jgi:hypothetical protein
MKLLKGLPVSNLRRKKLVSLEHLHPPTKFWGVTTHSTETIAITAVRTSNLTG